jgi:excisionase family DNA binding protein
MDDLLTTRQVQEILKVDRITIYRMLNDGRIKGVKVGQQWRFPLPEVERIVRGETDSAVLVEAAADASFPTHCVQTIQDLFSDVSQVSAVVIDLNGEQLTQVSGACSICKAMQSSPNGLAGCQASWKQYAQHSNEAGRYFTCHAGFQYVGAPIRDRDSQIGVFLAGPFYWQPPDPREETARLRGLAEEYNLPLATLQQAARDVQVIDPSQHARLETWPFTAARAVQSILHERLGFMERLQKIATLTQM